MQLANEVDGWSSLVNQVAGAGARSGHIRQASKTGGFGGEGGWVTQEAQDQLNKLDLASYQINRLVSSELAG